MQISLYDEPFIFVNDLVLSEHVHDCIIYNNTNPFLIKKKERELRSWESHYLYSVQKYSLSIVFKISFLQYITILLGQ